MWDRERVHMGLARRLARSMPGVSSRWLKNPCFAVGFNNSGKSTLMSIARRDLGARLYPDEGNGELWFPGLFPWLTVAEGVPPIWHGPETFIEKALEKRNDQDFSQARAQLGAYQVLCRAPSLINDSGMLAALLPRIHAHFPEARYLYMERNGLVSAYIAARMNWMTLLRSPKKYRQYQCSLEFEDVLQRTARYWAWTRLQVETVHRQAPQLMLCLQYEKAFQNLEDTLASLCQFLDLEPRRPLAQIAAEYDYLDMNAVVLTDLSAPHRALIEAAMAEVRAEAKTEVL